MFLVGNFFKEECYANLWAVSLSFQLSFLALLPCWLYAQGGKHRRWAYGSVYAIVTMSLLARFTTVFVLNIALDPVGDGEHVSCRCPKEFEPTRELRTSVHLTRADARQVCRDSAPHTRIADAWRAFRLISSRYLCCRS